MSKCHVASLISTKGGVGKSTLAANIGAIVADAGLTVLLIDLDPQPTLTTYHDVSQVAPGGTLELLTQKEAPASAFVSQTAIPRLDLIASNDRNNLLPTLLRNSPDGRIRLNSVLPKLEDNYDLIIIDTPGTHSILVEVAVLASSVALSPINPETLSAREFRRGTVRLLDDLMPFTHFGIKVPDILSVVNKLDATTDARLVTDHLRDTLADEQRVRLLNTQIPNTVIFREAATRGMPVHRMEVHQPSNRKRPALLQTIKALASEIFPEWQDRLEAVSPQAFTP